MLENNIMNSRLSSTVKIELVILARVEISLLSHADLQTHGSINRMGTVIKATCR
jgi:hypothetical protein